MTELTTAHAIHTSSAKPRVGCSPWKTLWFRMWYASVGAMNHKNHITRIVMQICPWSGLSISSVSCNYFYTCKVRIINIRVNTIINHPRAVVALASELSATTRKDVNSPADLLRCNAEVMLCLVLLIHYLYSGHYYSIVCGAKWDH